MKPLLLWGSAKSSPPTGYVTVYWDQYISDLEKTAGNISLPETIHQDANYWKPRYLAWLDSVGKNLCGPQSIVDTLRIRPGLSYWWMTIPSEYSFTPRSIAYSTLRLWALAQIVDSTQVQEIFVGGCDAALEEVLTLWCTKTGRQVKIIPRQINSKDTSQTGTISSRLKKRIPALVKGLGYLFLEYCRYFSRHRDQRPSKIFCDPELTVVDYFVNFDMQEASEGNYASNYWGPLGPILHERSTTVNWIHIDLRSEDLPSVRSARIAIRNLNQRDSSTHHSLMQDHLTLRVLFKTAKQYWGLRRISKQVAGRLQWLDTLSGIDVGPLVHSRLHSDLRGVGAANRALWLSLFEEALPLQATSGACIYLMENHPWELALLQTRTTRGSGLNIGVAHTLVRTWDLQYALGSFSDRDSNNPSLPTPSRVAVIDPNSESVLIANGYKASELVKVEALRFLWPISTNAEALKKRNDAPTKKLVLICGEYDSLMCARQLQLLEELIPLIKDNYAFTFRGHPGIPILQESLPPGVSLSKSRSLSEDLARCDVVLCSNVSSVSLNANLQGIPILMLRDGRVFAGSFLGVGPKMQYVNNATDVAALLEEHKFVEVSMPTDSIYPMYRDEELKKWHNLLDGLLENSDH